MAENWTSSLDLCVELDRRGSLRNDIERAIRRAIRDGRLPVGTKLPSTRALAHDLGVARGTVAQAYEQLAVEGHIQIRHGAVSRVIWSPSADDVSGLPAPERTHRWDLRPGQPDGSSFPRQAWAKATRAVCQQLPPGALGYGDSEGTIALRKALAAYLGRARSVLASAERLLICAGFTQALTVICQALEARGVTAIAMEDPCAPRYRELVARSGLSVVAIPCDAAGIQVARLRDVAAGAVVVTPAHQYPLGVTLSPARRHALITWARSHDAFIIEDDYDGEFRFDRRPVGSLQQMAADRVIYAGTASKTLAPAARLGWLALPAGIRGQAIEIKERLDRGNAVLDQLVLAELMSSGDFDRHIRRMRTEYRRRRDYLADVLGRTSPWADVTGIQAGMHAVVTLRGGVRATAVLDAARRRGLLLHTLASYLRHASDSDPQALVVGYGTPAASAFRPAVGELAAALVETRRR